jgi:GNAT superfamily N-acetyltransferase
MNDTRYYSMSKQSQQPELLKYLIDPVISNNELNELFALSWESHADMDFEAIHLHSLTYVICYNKDKLIGYINVAWNGCTHAFLLNTTVHPDWRHKGIGRALVEKAAAIAKDKGVHWLHVDYEPHLGKFYKDCGFNHTEAGLMFLRA